MNREIFFRAWSMETKKMYWFDLTWGNFGHGGGGYIGMVEVGLPRDTTKSYEGNVRLVDPHDCEIMQSTGIEDKNGIYIYEGDIIRSFEQDDFTKEIIFKHGAFGYVSSHDNSFISFHSNRCNLEMIQKRIYQSEIIGNIHQNPELLNIT